MDKAIYRISLDISRNGIQRTIQGLETGDRYAREIRIVLRNGREEFELPIDNNITAMMYVRTPSSTTPSINECTIDGNEIVYALDPNDVCEIGTTIMQLKVVSNAFRGAERVLVAPRFAVEVWESEIDDSTAESTATYTALENALANATTYYNKRFDHLNVTDDYRVQVFFADGYIYESDELNKITSVIGKQYEEIEEVKRMVQDVASRMASLESDYSRFKTEMEADFNALDTNVSLLDAKVDTYDSRLAGVESGVATNTANIATNTSNISVNTSAIAQNTSDIEQNTSDIAQNTADIAQNTADIEELKNRPSGGSEVEVTQILTSGTQIAVIKVDDEDTILYAPTGGGGGGGGEDKMDKYNPTSSGTFTHTGNANISGAVSASSLSASSVSADTMTLDGEDLKDMIDSKTSFEKMSEAEYDDLPDTKYTDHTPRITPDDEDELNAYNIAYKTTHVGEALDSNATSIVGLTEGLGETNEEVSELKQNIVDLSSAPILLYDSVAEGKTDIDSDMEGTIEDITHFKEIIITNDYYSNVLFSKILPSNHLLNESILISAADPFGSDKFTFSIRFTSTTAFYIPHYQRQGNWEVMQLLIYGIK